MATNKILQPTVQTIISTDLFVLEIASGKWATFSDGSMMIVNSIENADFLSKTEAERNREYAQSEWGVNLSICEAKLIHHSFPLLAAAVHNGKAFIRENKAGVEFSKKFSSDFLMTRQKAVTLAQSSSAKLYGVFTEKQNV